MQGSQTFPQTDTENCVPLAPVARNRRVETLPLTSVHRLERPYPVRRRHAQRRYVSRFRLLRSGIDENLSVVGRPRMLGEYWKESGSRGSAGSCPVGHRLFPENAGTAGSAAMETMRAALPLFFIIWHFGPDRSFVIRGKRDKNGRPHRPEEHPRSRTADSPVARHIRRRIQILPASPSDAANPSPFMTESILTRGICLKNAIPMRITRPSMPL